MKQYVKLLLTQSLIETIQGPGRGMLSTFDGRVEIYSPGGLMPGLKIKKLEGTHETKKIRKFVLFFMKPKIWSGLEQALPK